jgi:membrane protein DedA with SNARE-associated domain
MTGLPESLDALATYLHQYGYAAVFGSVLLESFGVPLPGETMLIAGALLAARGGMHLAPLLLSAWAAAVLGDNIGYAIGRFGGRLLITRYGRPLGITEARVDRVEGFFRHYGGWIVIVARFFELLRQLNGIVAGSAGMSWWRFFAYNALGGALWVSAWGIGVFTVGERLGALAPWIHRVGYLAIGLAALALLVAAVVVRGRRRASGSEERG